MLCLPIKFLCLYRVFHYIGVSGTSVGTTTEDLNAHVDLQMPLAPLLWTIDRETRNEFRSWLWEEGERFKRPDSRTADAMLRRVDRVMGKSD